MKKSTNKKAGKPASRQMTRREFVGGAIAAAGVMSGAPAILRGQNLNNKLNIAFIACGGRANASLGELTIVPGRSRRRRRTRREHCGDPAAPHPDENVTVLCDMNQDALDPRRSDTRRPRSSPTCGGCSTSPNDFDAVVVSTAEHTHAFATYLALTHGKHVYCEKPLAYNIWETRLIRETAAKYPKLSTQMGNQGHASPARRTIREILDTGVIGPVHEVHVWADRAWGLQDAASAEKFDKPHGFYNGIQIVDRFKEEMPIPPTHALGSVARPGAGAAVSRDLFSRAAVVSLVGFRQRHDERSRQPRQRRAVHGAGSLAAGRKGRATCWRRCRLNRFRPTCR